MTKNIFTERAKKNKEKKRLSTIFPFAKVKPQLEDAVLKMTPKAVLVGIIPFFTDDFKGDVLKDKGKVQTENSLLFNLTSYGGPAWNFRMEKSRLSSHTV
jgi:hypothetical protein